MTTFLAVLGGITIYAIIGRFTWYCVLLLDEADGTPTPHPHDEGYITAWWASHLAWPVCLVIAIYGVFDVGSRLDQGAKRDS